MSCVSYYFIISEASVSLTLAVSFLAVCVLHVNAPNSECVCVAAELESKAALHCGRNICCIILIWVCVCALKRIISHPSGSLRDVTEQTHTVPCNHIYL